MNWSLSYFFLISVICITINLCHKHGQGIIWPYGHQSCNFPSKNVSHVKRFAKIKVVIIMNRVGLNHNKVFDEAGSKFYQFWLIVDKSIIVMITFMIINISNIAIRYFKRPTTKMCKIESYLCQCSLGDWFGSSSLSSPSSSSSPELSLLW